MKTLFLLLSIALCGAVQAQTNAVKGAATKSPPAPTEINSDTADFDLSASARQAVYRGHVVVVDPQMKLKCEQLVVYLPPSGERVNHIVAQTNVVIDFADQQGQMTHAVADLADYRYLVSNGVTNETVTLTGNPQVENSQGTLTGDPINWDRGNNRMTATNPHMKSKPAVEGSTNAAPLKLF